MVINFFGSKLRSGESKIKQFKVAEFADGTPISLLVRAVSGLKEGPIISMLGAQHGDEYNGIVAINRLLDQLNPEELSGTVIAIPLSNPLAFYTDECMAPPSMGYRRLNMNTVWPGDKDGMLTQRIVSAIWENIIIDSDYIIDFHDGGRIIICRYILAEHLKETDRHVVDQIEKLYRLFGQGVPVQFLDHSGHHPRMGALRRLGSLSIQAGLIGIPCIMAEMGGGLRIWEEHVQTAIQGAKNIMIGLGMLQEEPMGYDKEQIVARQSAWLRSNHGGMLYNNCELNEIVEKKASLGVVKDIAGRSIENIYAPYKSILTDIRYQPKVHSGDWLYWCGKVE